jgi:hypothetical protein
MVVDDRLGDVDRFVSTVLGAVARHLPAQRKCTNGRKRGSPRVVLIPGRRREGGPNAQKRQPCHVLSNREDPETADAEEDDDDQRRGEEVVWSKVLAERRAVPGRIVT